MCATASIQYFTRFASHGHLNVGFLVGADMVLPMMPRKTSHLVQRGRKTVAHMPSAVEKQYTCECAGASWDAVAV